VACQRRKQDATLELTKSQLTVDVLRREWAAQINEQTKPLIRQSRDLANKVIHEVLALMSTHALYQGEMGRYEEMMAAGDYEEGMDVTAVAIHLEELQKKSAWTAKAIQQKRASLDVDGRLSLHKLIDNKFLQVRMNALALKRRIRNRLQQRKFELDGLERAYRKSTNGVWFINIHYYMLSDLLL
jgi:hypothetical protein